MFKLFDEDGNGNISIDELLNMMAFFIELGMDTGNVDMAKTMAEVFSLGDINKDDTTTVDDTTFDNFSYDEQSVRWGFDDKYIFDLKAKTTTDNVMEAT